MMLHKKHYVRSREDDKPEVKIEVTATKGGKPIKGIDFSKVIYLEEDVMYWRKANAIHAWFVRETQNGEDNNGEESSVYPEQMKELLAICERIIAECPLVEGKVKNGSHLEGGKWIDNMEDGKVMTNTALAEELLPTQSGFFFGGTDYDEYYMHDIIETRDMLKRELAIEDNRADYYYHSSW